MADEEMRNAIAAIIDPPAWSGRPERGNRDRHRQTHTLKKADAILNLLRPALPPELSTDRCPHAGGENGCTHTRESFAKRSTCHFGGCPWGGDF